MEKEQNITMSEMARIMGRKGGKRLKEKKGLEHYSRLGKIGSAKRWGKKLST